jgi:geranylgeranyl pyrophosphate synthase
VGRSCFDSELTPQHRSLAEITEMIHTASLVHDDVLDECDTRRGNIPPYMIPLYLIQVHQHFFHVLLPSQFS